MPPGVGASTGGSAPGYRIPPRRWGLALRPSSDHFVAVPGGGCAGLAYARVSWIWVTASGTGRVRSHSPSRGPPTPPLCATAVPRRGRTGSRPAGPKGGRLPCLTTSLPATRPKPAGYPCDQRTWSSLMLLPWPVLPRPRPGISLRHTVPLPLRSTFSARAISASLSRLSISEDSKLSI